MAHGAPDYSNVQSGGLIYRLDDMGELAVRLGSPVKYDRRGNVLFIADFENGLSSFGIATDPANSAVNLVTTPVLHGNYAAQLYAEIDTFSYAQITRRLPLTSNLAFGATYFFKPTIWLEYAYLEIRIQIDDQTTYYTIRVDYQNDRIQLYNSVGGYTTVITDLGGLHSYDVFVPIKLTFNAESGTYRELLFQDVSYDVSDVTPRTIASVGPNLITLSIVNEAPLIGDSSLYVDSIIITTNEP